MRNTLLIISLRARPWVSNNYVVMGVVLGLLLFPVTAAASPAWWSGDCNVNNHTGSAPLGASLDDTKACGPGSSYQGGYDLLVHYAPGLWGEYEWQCVELVMRYMYLVYGISPYNSPGGKDVVNNYTGTRLSKVMNNGTSLPSVGDVIAVGPANPQDKYGHTAIVTAINTDSSGTGIVTIMEQNGAVGSNGSRNIAVTNKAIGDNVTAWLHDPEADSIQPGNLTQITTPAAVGACRI